jgi:hypothetical protein
MCKVLFGKSKENRPFAKLRRKGGVNINGPQRVTT